MYLLKGRGTWDSLSRVHTARWRETRDRSAGWRRDEDERGEGEGERERARPRESERQGERA